MKTFGMTAKLLLAGSLILTLAGCSSTMDMSGVKAVVDLRAPSAFAAGHLKGAVNYYLEDATFVAKVSDLGRHGEVLVYCDTDACGGNARNQMLQIGFDNVINLGDLNAAAKTTGVAIIKN